MIDIKDIKKYILIGATVLLPTACSQDAAELSVADDGDAVQLTSCMSRAQQGAPIAPQDNVAIEIFTTMGTDVRRGSFTYLFATDSWKNSNVKVMLDENYYIYGFMPLGAGTTLISPYEGDYQNGALLTINDLPPVSTDDFCYVAGVKGGKGVTTQNDITPWNYHITGMATGENYVNLLMDHLYTGILLRIVVGSNYGALRTVKLKKLELVPSSKKKVNINITQQSGNSVLTEYVAATDDATIPYMLNSEEGIPLSTDTPVTTEAYLLPTLTGLTLVSTYDIYDNEGHLIRQNSTAENDITGMVTMRQGYKTVLTMTVAPSYLYVLSDPDALNPIISSED